MPSYHFKPFTSKQDAFDRAVPIYACSSCWTKHDAPKHARCGNCNHIAPAIKKTPGVRMNRYCPNCAMPKLKNEHIKPFACSSCGGLDFEFFDSTGEYNMFAQLVMLNNRGKIRELRRQVPFPITIKGDKAPLTTYYADYVFEQKEADGTYSKKVIDFKGDESAIDPLFKLKKKLVERFYPGVTVEVVTNSTRRK